MTYGKVLHTEQHGERIVNVRRSTIYDEFRCRLYVYGKAQPAADYFTNDLDDAKSTAKAMATLRHVEPVTIDVMPTWEGLLPVYLAAIQDGNAEGRELARAELRRMAQAADKWNASVKPNPAARIVVQHVPADDTEGGAL